MDWLSKPFEAITNFLKSIFSVLSGLGDLLTDIFIGFFEGIYDGVSGVINAIKDLFSLIGNKFSSLFSFFEPLFDRLFSLLDYINPFSKNFFLKIAFIPNIEDIIFDDVKNALYEKFAFLSSFEEIHKSFENTFNNETGCPEFTITLPSFLGGSVVKPIDFRFFNNYRGLIHGFIIAISYFLFIEKTYKKIPNIIKGG